VTLRDAGVFVLVGWQVSQAGEALPVTSGML
jgi:hypothetical protein